MRYTLITFLACPVCAGDLSTIVAVERPAPIPARNRALANVVPPEGAVVAPLSIGELLSRHAANPVPPARDYAVEVETGLLVCLACARWFPVSGCLPELLPDHLRERERDARLFEECAHKLPPDLVEGLRSAAPPAAPAGSDKGISYKQSEIGIKRKVDDQHFFSPGFSSPFNPHDTDYTLYLIKLFGSAVPLLELRNGDALLDSGCGYAWTTEWLYKAGVEAIGVDICRTYLDVGIERMGANRPHLVVADIEHLPMRAESVNAVFAFETAHHWPDRNTAMRGFGRALRAGGRVVLAEPGAAHEHAQGSVTVMDKYGILEKGMELEDVEAYVAGTQMGKPEQIFLLKVSEAELGRRIDRVFVHTHSVVEGNLFRIPRDRNLLDTVKAVWREPRRVVWPRVKRRVKGALVRLGLE
jgi:SAM-dependent methyltransferase/uncharacterized protein YbaR (Trm112 family)